MATISALAAAATQTSSLGIFTLFDSSHIRLPPSATSASASSPSLPLPHHIQESFVINRTSSSTFLSPDPSAVRPNSDRSSYSSSPRQYPTELTDPILEEGDETDSEVANEPVTPVSGRQSQDFQTLANHEIHPDVAQEQVDQSVTSFPAVRAGTTTGSKPPLVLNTDAATPPRAPPKSSSSSVISNTQTTPRAAEPATPTTGTHSVDLDPAPHPPTRRPTFSSSGIRRNMSSFIKRVTHPDRSDAVNGYSEHPVHENGRKMPTRRWSMNRSSATTRSNTPPSPGSPVEMAIRSKEQASTPTVPSSDEFIKKKPRASTNFLRSRPHVPKHAELQLRRRASSFDYTSQEKALVASTPHGPVNVEKIERQIWEMPAETGTGLKARRMSLSLPDDFVVDVVELQSEFEYENKLLGRHGKSVGKGGHGKVKTMARKGSPTELVAVKEFRSKSRSETKEDYENKIKSEYTLSKSLNHPNVVTTFRLCIDHGRWNHVMEFCSEGDLYGLVKEGYLKGEDKEKDRLCLFKQLVRGVHYLHSNGIAHRDIKLENLLITSDSALKIADFGVSEVFCGSHPGLRESGGQCGKNMGEIRRCAPGICGSMPYLAPEVLKKEGDYDPRGVDVWSSAVVMLHLIFGGAIWQKAVDGDNSPNNKNFIDLVRGWAKWNDSHKDTEEPAITEMDYPKVKAFDFGVRPPALRRVLLQMLNPNPDQRTSIHDVANNRWVKNIECCQKADNEEPDPATTMIDASKSGCLIRSGEKLFCHNHLPPKKQFSSHSLGKMPGSVGY
ncbi:kinase-like domain-containing protein [Cercophora samala]|uniref:Kinase-like domain-containing protein n=1 Tax=Cercophora samala TaxID=330535 RepID=A0AA40D5L7_9PEZI|nr:kinase-like domain-containing protein [Cercophora samala]